MLETAAGNEPTNLYELWNNFHLEHGKDDNVGEDYQLIKRSRATILHF